MAKRTEMDNLATSDEEIADYGMYIWYNNMLFSCINKQIYHYLARLQNQHTRQLNLQKFPYVVLRTN